MKLRPVLFWFFCAVVLAGCGQRPYDDVDVALNDRGVAEMGRFEYAKAEQTFSQLVESAPAWIDARVNHAIATLNRQSEGDEALALTMLDAIVEDDPAHLRARYTRGIIHLYVGDAEAAAREFRVVVASDPADAYAAYFLGQSLLQLREVGAAAEWFLRARELDPYLRSSYWAAAQALRQGGREDEASGLIDEYERFARNPAARLASFAYTRMGPKAEAISVSDTTLVAPEPPRGSLFRTPVTLVRGNFVEPSITVADLDGDHDPEFAIAHQNGVELFSSTGASMSIPFSGMFDAALLWGDIDDDGTPDVVTCSGNGTTLWLRRGAGWERTDFERAPCRDGAVFDADHDGDLDVLIARESGIELFSNNEDGTFRRLGGLLGLDDVVGMQVVVTDLDADRDLDILVLGERQNRALLNDRTWQYERTAELAGFDDLPLLGAVAVDVDADGWVEVYGLAADASIKVWRRDRNLTWVTDDLVDATRAGGARSLAAVDFDGDGVLEIISFGDAGMVGYRPDGGEAYRFDGRNRALTSAVRDPARGPSLLMVDSTGLSEQPPGAGRFPFLAIRPTGRSDSDQLRSNASGIGTQLSLRHGGRWTVVEALDSHSARGQSLEPFAFGLGGATVADLHVKWSDGVAQTEVRLAVGELHVITETQRQLASCPIVFAWDGTGYSFISDVLGVAGLGFLHSPNRYNPPRPFERYLLNESQLAARDGRYEIKLTEPMEETAYLDAITLEVFELPLGWSMVLDERMGTAAPEVTGRPITFREEIHPVAAHSSSAGDALEALRDADGVAPDSGPTDARFIGLLQEDQVLTVDFDTVLEGDDLVLVAEGWVEYPYSQTVFSAWQAGLRYEPVSIDARDRNGRWHRLFQEFGYPAGMPRTMALPLGRLPTGTTALRLSSNLEIYWDRLRVVREERLTREQMETFSKVLRPVEARVRRTGFPVRTNLAQRRPSYDYADRETFWDAKVHRGYYTTFGDALELVAAEDSALAIFGSGEEIQVAFDALPPTTHRRLFAIDFRGFAKDMDLYTQHGDTVTPLPTPDGVGLTEAVVRERLHDRYNVRYQDGL